VRERISSKAQYTKSGLKPWTQITVSLPISSSDTTEEEDLAVVWAVMNESTRNEVKNNANGDLTWTQWGSQNLNWLGKDWKNMKPVDLYVHPVHYETGARKKIILKTKLRKAQKAKNLLETTKIIEELSSLEKTKPDHPCEPRGHHYHWSNYEECNVIYKKKQIRKQTHKELQLIIKIRTYYLGNGVPEENNGYLQGCASSELLDPESKIYCLLKIMEC